MAALVASSNTVLTPSIIAKEALLMLMNNLVMGRLVNRRYKNEFKKVGTQISIRKPVKFSVGETAEITGQNVEEYSEVMTVATQNNVNWSFNTVELTMKIEEYSTRYIAPAAAELAQKVDYALTGLYTQVFSHRGTPGVTPSAYSDLGGAQTVLDQLAVPNPRVIVTDPDAHWALADGLKGTFAQQPVNDIHTKGYLGTVANLDFHMDQNIRRHTTGTFTTSATPLMAETTSDGDIEFDTDGWNATSSTIAAGDGFTVGDSAATYVYAVNPKSRVSTGALKQFVELTGGTSTGGGDFTFTVMTSTGEGLQDSDAYQNISRHPANGSTINMVGTEATAYPQNLIFHPNAFALVTMPLAMPAGQWGARVTDTQMGLSIRVIKGYDFRYDEERIRMDILYGTAALYPELALRLTG